MAMPARFLFDTDFSRPAVEEVVPVSEGAPVDVHVRLLANAAEEAYQRGLAEGRAAAEAQAARRVADEAGRLVSAAQSILGALDADRERIERDAATLAFAAARKLAATLVAREPTAEIETLIAECLGPLRQAPHIVIRVDERDVEAIKAEADRIAHERGFMGRLVVLGEPDLARGDCRIEWADGGIVRNMDEVAGEAEAAIERYFAARAADPSHPDRAGAVSDEVVPVAPEENTR
ncbi:MAG: flagellar assembly protein FliH [Hyphomicrobiales bacterium]|nr:MAG: flagellar assembly protein FliH [Hyphomicrobiales bacterium]